MSGEMKLFRSASLGDWIALVTFIGLITVFTVRASSLSTANKEQIEIISPKLEALEDTVMLMNANNKKEHKALEKTTRATYSLVSQMAKKQGILIPEEGI